MTMPASRMPRGSISVPSACSVNVASSVNPVRLVSAHEDPGEDAGQPEAQECRQEGDVGRRADAVGEVQRDERHRAGGHEGNGNRVVAVEERRQREPHDHEQTDRQAGDGADATPATEHDDGDHEQPGEDQQRSRTLVVVERVHHLAVGGSRRDDPDVVAGREVAAFVQLERPDVAFGVSAGDPERDRAAHDRRVGGALALDHLGDVGIEWIGAERQRVLGGSATVRPQQDRPDHDEHGARHDRPTQHLRCRAADVDVEVVRVRVDRVVGRHRPSLVSGGPPNRATPT